jgi:Holliday junction resolvasome RuvABC DNA-binding subunit
MIQTMLTWIAAIIGFAYLGCHFANWVDEIEQRHAPPNPEHIKALMALGYKKRNAVALASKVDPDLDTEIALQVIFSEYGEL